MNALGKATSPYLLQHAENPVDWYEWGAEALNKAKAENKPILISIGYSACHWCHVMAHEVFEDEESAKRMNENFINIKIDREERPDIDQIYMDAIQLLNGRGGWPLNIFALPDGRPFYGGTYFPRKDWNSVLIQLSDLWKQKTETVYEYAAKLSAGVTQTNLIESGNTAWQENDLHRAIQIIKTSIDQEQGGFNRAPKFPLPVVYHFVLHYTNLYPDPEMQQWLLHSLTRMSTGGLYDVVEGGYSRYSVDLHWHVPHFEKMLYDNAQMLSFLAETYMVTGNEFLKQKIGETIGFIEKEWLTKEGGVYSAYDADSEGEEGKYYCYTSEDLKRIGITDKDILSYFHCTDAGNWESGRNILFATQTPSDFAKQNTIPLQDFKVRLEQALAVLREERKKRVKPGLDDKILAGWNAMLATGLLKCYNATGIDEYLNLGKKVLSFIGNNLYKEGKLYRSYKNGIAGISGFLEDHVFYAEALLCAYNLTFEDQYLLDSHKIVQTVLNEFGQEHNPYFVFNPDPAGELFVKKTDLGDDVIPSANAVMCELLLKLGYYFDLPQWREHAERMIRGMNERVLKGPAWYCRWLSSALLFQSGLNQVTIAGKDLKDFKGMYLPNTVFLKPSNLIPLSMSKDEVHGAYYLCRDTECYAPETDYESVLNRLY
ncbi:MAG: thioredoxin domain-containing protein [Flavobacteriales bacterium]|nr:thioredoxin domain-containing protein [Flavobacteriales bacterium]